MLANTVQLECVRPFDTKDIIATNHTDFFQCFATND